MRRHAAAGETQMWFPHAKTVHRTVLPPLPHLWNRFFAVCDSAKGLCPLDPHELLKKLEQNFLNYL